MRHSLWEHGAGLTAGMAIAAGLGIALIGIPTVSIAEEFQQEDAASHIASNVLTTSDEFQENATVSTPDAAISSSSVELPTDGSYADINGDTDTDDQVDASGSESSGARPEVSEVGPVVTPVEGDVLVSDGTADSSAEAGEVGITSEPKVDAGKDSEGDTSAPSVSAEGDSVEGTESPMAAGWNSTKTKYADETIAEDGTVTYSYRTGWLVDATRDNSLQRYWFDADGNLVVDRLIDTLDGFWAYARSEGYVVRGLYKAANGNLYYADNDGKLWAEGWHVAAIDGRGLERYYVEADSHAMVEGYSESGYAHYTTSNGTTLRGVYDAGTGRVYLADNDGRLEAQSGWVVTAKYTGSLQRYYVVDGAAKSGYFSVDGSNYFGVGGRGYVLRGVGKGVFNDWLVADNDGKLKSSQWMVTDIFGQGLQRYWFDAKGAMAKSRLVDASEGAGYYAYATAGGYVLRGIWDAGTGRVYLADNDGRLAQGEGANGTGWLVTGTFTNGQLQRYYIDDVDHAARSSFFVVDGVQYYGFGNKGYVLRNGVRSGSQSYFADNEGRISGSGWLVTDSFGMGLQRYWMSDNMIVTSRLIDAAEAGWFAYARPEGFVVRGRYAATGDRVYLANNDGKLEDTGWRITGAYDGGALQRFYIDEDTHACKVGFFKVGAESYYGLSKLGYVLRGSTTVDGKTYHADNDGMLVLSFSSDVKTEKKATGTVVSTFVGDTPYLFLPAHANLGAVVLNFKTFDGAEGILISLDGGATYTLHASGEGYDVSKFAESNGVRTILFRTSEGSKLRTLAIMMSANVRAMYLVSEDPINQGRAFVDGSASHSAKAKGTMLLVDPNGTVVYNGDLSQIKGRGNSTWAFSDKKPYQIKLDKKTDLLETGNKDNKAKTWILLANASDSTLIHNTIAYQLARALGLSSTPEGDFVDLYYDGEYRGSYFLCEKVEINSGRVDIYKLEDAVEEANPGVDLSSLPLERATNKYGQSFQYVRGVKDPSDISGGYLLELDIAWYASERCWFQTSIGAFVVKGPENLSYNQMRYISERMQEMIDAGYYSGVNPNTGVALGDYVSRTSLARMYAINELTKNIDYHVTSCFFYLPSASDAAAGYRNVFYAGPAWDFDTAFGVRVDTSTVRDPNTVQFNGGGGTWYQYTPEMSSLISQTFLHDLLPIVEKGVLAHKSSVAGVQSIDELVKEVSASQRMNQVLWGLTSFPNCVDPYPTYGQNVQYLKDWIAQRVSWAKSYYA